MPSSTRLRSITSASRALPNAERCERPTKAADRASTDQPGRFAHGPEAKFGREGLVLGSFMAVLARPTTGGARRAERQALGSLHVEHHLDHFGVLGVEPLESQRHV